MITMTCLIGVAVVPDARGPAPGTGAAAAAPGTDMAADTASAVVPATPAGIASLSLRGPFPSLWTNARPRPRSVPMNDKSAHYVQLCVGDLCGNGQLSGPGRPRGPV